MMEVSGDKTQYLSGRVITLAEYFEKNPKSIHHINGDQSRKGVILNGSVIEIGSIAWKNIALTPIYQDDLLGELRIIYHNKRI